MSNRGDLKVPYVSSNSGYRSSKPPLGLLPMKLHNDKRIEDITEAVVRYFEFGMAIPKEWIEEYNDLIEKKAKE
jgi:phage gp29-like protein